MKDKFNALFYGLESNARQTVIHAGERSEKRYLRNCEDIRIEILALFAELLDIQDGELRGIISRELKDFVANAE